GQSQRKTQLAIRAEFAPQRPQKRGKDVGFFMILPRVEPDGLEAGGLLQFAHQHLHDRRLARTPRPVDRYHHWRDRIGIVEKSTQSTDQHLKPPPIVPYVIDRSVAITPRA